MNHTIPSFLQNAAESNFSIFFTFLQQKFLVLENKSMQSLKISLYEILLSLANAQDLALPEITLHHQQVANLALRIAQEAGLSLADQKEIYIAALVHDVGALSMRERFELIEGTAFNMHTHAVRGAKLLETFEPLKRVAEFIRYHHTPWNKGRGAEDNGRKIEMGSHIIHLADRICIKLKPGKTSCRKCRIFLPICRSKAISSLYPSL
jgi:putative nucleotidyltransferase with HDIG domain